MVPEKWAPSNVHCTDSYFFLDIGWLQNGTELSMQYLQNSDTLKLQPSFHYAWCNTNTSIERRLILLLECRQKLSNIYKLLAL